MARQSPLSEAQWEELLKDAQLRQYGLTKQRAEEIVKPAGLREDVRRVGEFAFGMKPREKKATDARLSPDEQVAHKAILGQIEALAKLEQDPTKTYLDKLKARNTLLKDIIAKATTLVSKHMTETRTATTEQAKGTRAVIEEERNRLQAAGENLGFIGDMTEDEPLTRDEFVDKLGNLPKRNMDQYLDKAASLVVRMAPGEDVWAHEEVDKALGEGQFGSKDTKLPPDLDNKDKQNERFRQKVLDRRQLKEQNLGVVPLTEETKELLRNAQARDLWVVDTGKLDANENKIVRALEPQDNLEKLLKEKKLLFPQEQSEALAEVLDFEKISKTSRDTVLKAYQRIWSASPLEIKDVLKAYLEGVGLSTDDDGNITGLDEMFKLDTASLEGEEAARKERLGERTKLLEQLPRPKEPASYKQIAANYYKALAKKSSELGGIGGKAQLRPLPGPRAPQRLDPLSQRRGLDRLSQAYLQRIRDTPYPQPPVIEEEEEQGE